ncbi:D-Ala-D-Ala carboxypeptidase family metallohydrolase [Rhodonellum sp.]|uniref:D-Ala-D-Ala carboxypeptidase family metallohydrolase n=1 Tax=Rhodonellum sp. TaxID=2231180 RepID=UPI00272890FD|nr:D-Ala-D-Ala carboxypeptidase family metallohydrolase [Rhodonellum sp.]MDO9554531.1 D-Ala-D-Ala carboxypeptidase family metallohydrolase [Rhodonellum sp.]
MRLKHFKISEFDSKDADGSGKGTGSKMQPCTLIMLDRAREIADIPFAVASGYRTPSHNKKVGGVSNSAHTLGYAVDIRTTPATQQKVINALREAGFKRIGIYRTFVHADNDPSKPSPATWKGK